MRARQGVSEAYHRLVDQRKILILSKTCVSIDLDRFASLTEVMTCLLARARGCFRNSQKSFPGCENVAGKLRQKCYETVLTKFSKPGNDF